MPSVIVPTKALTSSGRRTATRPIDTVRTIASTRVSRIIVIPRRSATSQVCKRLSTTRFNWRRLSSDKDATYARNLPSLQRRQMIANRALPPLV
eukprot:6346467-Prymnesium_polylepis.2